MTWAGVGNYYASTTQSAPETSQLAGDVTTSVAIVGAGFTGLGAALELAKHQTSCVVLDAGPVGFGASGRNGGQAHIGQRQDQLWLERVMGADDARKLWDLALDARAHLDDLLSSEGIECDFTSGLLDVDHKRRFVRETREYVAHLNTLYGYSDVRFVDQNETRALVASDNYYGGKLDTRGGHLNPLKLTHGIATAALRAGAKIFTHTRVTKLERSGMRWRLTTPHGVVTADKVILAGDGTLQGLSKPLDARVIPINNFIAVTAPLASERAAALIRNRAAVSDSRFVVYYFRLTPDNRLLFGGGENYSYRFPADIASFVRPHILRIFPQLQDVGIDFAWGGTLGITTNRMPLVREIEPGLITAAGYSGLGVVLAPYFGKILAQSIISARGNGDDFGLLARVPNMRFPGGPALRWPTLIAAMSFFALRDRL